MKLSLYLFFIVFLGFSACKKQEVYSQASSTPTVVSYLKGSSADVNTTTKGGLLLMGGGKDVDTAIEWLLNRSGSGDIVVLRSSGADGYNNYMYDMVNVNSVETLIIDSREKANLASVEQKIKNAEALFIAGGDQWNYVNYWKNTPVETAINYLINTKKVSVGGTSAGCAILGNTYFNAAEGSVTSDEALQNPFNKYMTLGQNDFVDAPNMQNTITDSHYTQRNRQGRHLAFLAKMMKDFNNTVTKGIGVDEQTAVCIDENGIGKIYGINEVYFLQNNNLGAETWTNGTPLNWVRGNQAVKAYKITGSAAGNGSFNATNWTFSGGNAYFYYVNNGIVGTN